jgi:hypothetical protein
MLHEVITTITPGQEAMERRSIAPHLPAVRPVTAATVAIFVWPLLSLGLILMKLLIPLSLSWMLVLTPIWLPALAVALVLVAAMWLDQIAMRRSE